jgi:hypothetical protein
MLLPLLFLAATAMPPVIDDEAKVPPYTVPDVLVATDGHKVATAKEWNEVRRAEVMKLVEDHIYGVTPAAAKPTAAPLIEVVETDKSALGGKATRTQYKVRPNGKDGLVFDLLLYVPNGAKGPVPVFLGLNFGGNHTTVNDPAVLLPSTWVSKQWADVTKANRATDKSRGVQAARWQAELVVSRGYGLATVYCGDFEPDHPEGWKEGIRAAYASKDPTAKRADNDWGCIGAWAWGLSRTLDALAANPAVDAKRVAVIGHSRLGKASLWAGAQDQRFALVISNESGCGGAALGKRIFGETVGVISGHYKGRGFPHWFAPKYETYSEHEDLMPLDQHHVLALVAPRPLYVASAEGDRWSDPKGEFLGALYAEPVFKLLGGKGLGVAEMPAVGVAVGQDIGYHDRPGKHDVTEEDWRHYLDFADRNLK